MSAARLALLLAAMYWCVAVPVAFGVGAGWRYDDGLRLTAWRNPSWAGPPAYTALDTRLSNDLIGESPFSLWPAFSIEWNGFLAVDAPGDFTFSLDTDDGSTLELDGAMVVDNGGPHREQRANGTRRLDRGMHPIRVRYFQGGGRSTLSVLWSRDGGPFHPLPETQLLPDPMSYTAYRLRPFRAVGVTLVALACCLGIFVGVWPRLRRLAEGSAAAALGRVALALERPGVAVAAIVGVGLLARLVMIESTPAILWPDSHVFYVTAKNVLSGQWASHDAYRTLVYPLVLAAFFRVSESPAAGLAVIATQQALGLVSAVLFYRASRRVAPPLVALAAGLLFVVHATELYYESAVLTETIFTATLAVAVWLAVRVIDRPTWPQAAALGLAAALLVLVRPVAQWYVVVPVMACLLATAPRGRRAAAAALMLACYALPVLWWMGVNQREYGFFGVALGRGMGLYTRVFEIDRLEPPNPSSNPELRDLWTFASLQRWSPNRVRDELNYARGYSSAAADDQMYRFALETLTSHPVAFAAGTARQWAQQLAEPYTGLRSCPSAFGRYLCSGRTDEESLPPFPNVPTSASRLRALVVRYVEDWQVPMTPVTALALIGFVVTAVGRRSPAALVFAATAAYLTLVPAATIAPQDRFRLPVDPLLFVFAFAGLGAVAAAAARAAHRWTGEPGQTAP